MAKTTPIAFRVPEKLLTRLDGFCEEHQTTRTEVLRALLDDAINLTEASQTLHSPPLAHDESPSV